MYILETTACDSLSVLGTILFIKNLLTILSYIVPVILILLITIDITKAVMANDDSAIKNAQKVAVKRLIAGLIVFFVPIIVDAMFKLVDDNGVLDLSCYTNANEQTVNALAEAEKEKLIQDEKDRQKLIKASKKNKETLQKEINKLRNKTIANAKKNNDTDSTTGATQNLYKKGTPASEAIAKTAEALSWPKGTPKSIYKNNYPFHKCFSSWSQLGKARPTDAFKTAYDKVRKGHFSLCSSDWGNGTSIGASCDVCAGTIVAYSGYDKIGFSLSSQLPHLRNSSKWKKVSSEKRGDICIKSSHIMIYLGNGRIAEAGYRTKRFCQIVSGHCGGSYTVYRATQ